MKKSICFTSFFLGVAMLLAQHPTIPFQLQPRPDFFKIPTDGNPIQPTGVAVNSKGHVYIFNKGHQKLMHFDAEGNYVRSLGEGIFKDPHGLRIDSEDNIWTTDLVTHLVLKLSPEGQVLMIMGQNGTQGLFDSTRNMVLFFKPADVAFAPNGDVYVADGYGNHRIVQVNEHGEFIRTWGEMGPAEGQFNNPHNIVYDRGKVYVADRYNDRIQVFDADGQFHAAWTDVGRPWGLAVSPERNLYMTDGDNERVLKMDMDGHILGTYEAGAGSMIGQMRACHGVACGLHEELYVTEVLNWRVQRFDQHFERGDWHRVLASGCSHRRSESAFVEVKGKFYALGGRNTRKVDIYDPVSGAWSQGHDAPLEMHHFQAINYQDEIWILGAFTGPYPKEEPVSFIHVYNPATDSWRVAGRLPDGRHRGAAGAITHNDKIYLLCGNQEGHYTGHNTWFDEFDPATGTWKSLPDAPHTRDHFQMAVIDNKLYAAGGRNTSQKTGHVMDQVIPHVDVYDFATGKWSTLSQSRNLPTLRAGTTVITRGDQLIVLGGESSSQIPAHSEVEAYDVSDRMWKQLEPMLQGRHGMQAIHYQGKVYVAGGSSDRGGGPELKTIDCWHLK